MFGTDARLHGFPLAGLSAEKYPPESLAGQLRVGGRLTLTSGTPVTTSDATGATSLYLTPFRGGAAPLLTSAGWKLLPFSEVTVSLSGVGANNNYDVWDFDGGDGRIICDLGPVWTDNITRSQALTSVDGLNVNAAGFKTLSGRSVQPFRARLRGTVRGTGTGTTEDGVGRHFVWNAHNRRVREFRRYETAGSWTYTTATYRQWNANAANQVEWVTGLDEDAVTVDFTGFAASSSAVPYLGLGLDITSAPTGRYGFGAIAGAPITVILRRHAGVGYHWCAAVEKGGTGVTFFGISAGDIQAGMEGWCMA